MRKYLTPTFLALFVLIIWDALKSYLGLSASAIQFLILGPVVIIGLLDNFNKRFFRMMFSRPISIWLIWIIYTLTNTFLITGFYHHRDQSPLVFISAILIAFLFILFIVNDESNTEDLIIVLIWAYFSRLLLSFIFDTAGIKGNDLVERFGIEFNANSVAFGALFLIILILIRKVRTQTFNNYHYFFIALSIYSIIISASKKTFIALVIFFLGFLYISRSKDLFKNLIKYFFFGAFLIISVAWILNNTSVGLRLIDSYIRTQEAKAVEGMFDSRLNQYIRGWEIFQEHPINGIGLTNYVHISGSNTPLHTEYMAQLTECGLIGVFLFVFFYFFIIKKLLFIHKKAPPLKRGAEIYLLSMLIMFVMFSGAWIYNSAMMWCLIALSIRFIKETEETLAYAGQINY